MSSLSYEQKLKNVRQYYVSSLSVYEKVLLLVSPIAVWCTRSWAFPLQAPSLRQAATHALTARFVAAFSYTTETHTLAARLGACVCFGSGLASGICAQPIIMKSLFVLPPNTRLSINHRKFRSPAACAIEINVRSQKLEGSGSEPILNCAMWLFNSLSTGSPVE